MSKRSRPASLVANSEPAAQRPRQEDTSQNTEPHERNTAERLRIEADPQATQQHPQVRILTNPGVLSAYSQQIRTVDPYPPHTNAELFYISTHPANNTRPVYFAGVPNVFVNAHPVATASTATPSPQFHIHHHVQLPQGATQFHVPVTLMVPVNEWNNHVQQRVQGRLSLQLGDRYYPVTVPNVNMQQPTPAPITASSAAPSNSQAVQPRRATSIPHVRRAHSNRIPTGQGIPFPVFEAQQDALARANALQVPESSTRAVTAPSHIRREATDPSPLRQSTSSQGSQPSYTPTRLQGPILPRINTNVDRQGTEGERPTLPSLSDVIAGSSKRDTIDLTKDDDDTSPAQSTPAQRRLDALANIAEQHARQGEVNRRAALAVEKSMHGKEMVMKHITVREGRHQIANRPRSLTWLHFEGKDFENGIPALAGAGATDYTKQKESRRKPDSLPALAPKPVETVPSQPVVAKQPIEPLAAKSPEASMLPPTDKGKQPDTEPKAPGPSQTPDPTTLQEGYACPYPHPTDPTLHCAAFFKQRSAVDRHLGAHLKEEAAMLRRGGAGFDKTTLVFGGLEAPMFRCGWCGATYLRQDQVLRHQNSRSGQGRRVACPVLSGRGKRVDLGKKWMGERREEERRRLYGIGLIGTDEVGKGAVEEAEKEELRYPWKAVLEDATRVEEPEMYSDEDAEGETDVEELESDEGSEVDQLMEDNDDGSQVDQLAEDKDEITGAAQIMDGNHEIPTTSAAQGSTSAPAMESTASNALSSSQGAQQMKLGTEPLTRYPWPSIQWAPTRNACQLVAEVVQQPTYGEENKSRKLYVVRVEEVKSKYTQGKWEAADKRNGDRWIRWYKEGEEEGGFKKRSARASVWAREPEQKV